MAARVGSGVNTVNIYPASGETINDGAANAAFGVER
jgi:hypothetical protein